MNRIYLATYGECSHCSRASSIRLVEGKNIYDAIGESGRACACGKFYPLINFVYTGENINEETL